MNEVFRSALIARLTALADDEVVLAQRNGEWVGHGPLLEEDIALANLVQDELGHAQIWLSLRQELDDSDPDQVVFWRNPQEYTCAEMLELPRGDWGFTLLRQYLFDAYEAIWLAAASHSQYTPLAHAAQKSAREERYHLQHSALWVKQLGLGTPQSQQRMQAALNTLWPYAQQLFIPLPNEAPLVEAGWLPDLAQLREAWLTQTTRHLQASGLSLPLQTAYQPTSRRHHTEHLSLLLAEMQSVARSAAPTTPW